MLVGPNMHKWQTNKTRDEAPFHFISIDEGNLKNEKENGIEFGTMKNWSHACRVYPLWSTVASCKVRKSPRPPRDKREWKKKATVHNDNLSATSLTSIVCAVKTEALLLFFSLVRRFSMLSEKASALSLYFWSRFLSLSLGRYCFRVTRMIESDPSELDSCDGLRWTHTTLTLNIDHVGF